MMYGLLMKLMSLIGKSVIKSLDKMTMDPMKTQTDLLMSVLDDNKDSSALAKHQTNFGLKTGETLYFSDRDLNIISAVPVLDLEKGKILVLGGDGKYHIN